jgi:integrase
LGGFLIFIFLHRVKVLSALYNHAIRWELIDRNPITGPVKGSGVRVSSKRMSIPDILTIEEMQKLISAVRLRASLDLPHMVTGLRRCELAGLKWEDIDFLNLQINVSRSVVEQHVGKCKTEVSQKPVPIDQYIAQDLLEWYRHTRITLAPTGFRHQQQPCRQKAWKTTTMAVQNHGLSHSARCQKAGDRGAYRVAHLPPHLLDPPQR